MPNQDRIFPAELSLAILGAIARDAEQQRRSAARTGEVQQQCAGDNLRTYCCIQASMRLSADLGTQEYLARILDHWIVAEAGDFGASRTMERLSMLLGAVISDVVADAETR